MKVVWLAALGGALEFYDFMIFVFLANIISPLFFPAENHLNSMLALFATFAVGYFARPIGGFVFSHYGDTIGRKKTFHASIILMAIPSLLIGLLPGYHTIGLAAPILLVVLRLIQGMAVGGEIPGAITFVYEHINYKKCGKMIAIIFVALSIAILFAHIVLVILHALLSKQQFINWGWRITFIIGACLAFVGAILRKNLQETNAFQQLLIQQKNVNKPFIFLLKNHFKEFIQSFIIVSLVAICMIIILVYMPIYISNFKTNLTLSRDSLSSLSTVNLIIFTISMFLMGTLSDFITRKKIIATGSFFILIFSFLLFHFILQGNFTTMFIAQTILGIIFSMSIGSFGALLPELFPTHIRYTGVSITYNLAFAVIGGTTPLVATLLIKFFHAPLAPAFYLMFFGLLSFVAAAFIK